MVYELLLLRLFRYYTKSDKISSNRKGKGDNSFVTVCDGGMAGKEFWIQTDERTWQFQAETICDAADWFDMLNTPCRNHRLKKVKLATTFLRTLFRLAVFLSFTLPKFWKSKLT